ncbi:uncharacterized protein LOC105690901 [Athalia rosae]|uniref:uncharacterized protein LOC105690901 n=1 Tax=Athalia rosae TaxID=37344 RepID=UPI0020337792|nr:uncharacterized protein LOC105690901 [Athalia rosae]
MIPSIKRSSEDCPGKYQFSREEMSVIVLLSVASALFSLITASPIAENGYKRFDGHKVYRVVATTEEQLKRLQTIETQPDEGILFWTPVIGLNTKIDIMVSPERDTEILSVFERSGLSQNTLIEDVQVLIDKENHESSNIGGRSSRVNGRNGTLNWTAYHRLEEIYDWLDKLAETYPQWVEVVVAGKSYEGRLIKGIKITFNKNNPGIFVKGGIHAREWISPATVTYLANEILTSTNEKSKLFYRTHTWFIFPNSNPDGYEFSHTTNRLWRKTRQPHSGICYGADANRNWDYHWMENGGASSYPCSESYAGPEPFSEPEAKAMADYIASVSQEFYIFLSIHSYSQLILLPYGYTSAHIPNYKESMWAAEKSANAIARRYGTEYVWGATAETIYYASGTSIDYVQGVHNTPFVYCYELRDQGAYGFLLPAEQIIPTALEFIDGLFALIGAIRTLGYPVIHTRADEPIQISSVEGSTPRGSGLGKSELYLVSFAHRASNFHFSPEGPIFLLTNAFHVYCFDILQAYLSSSLHKPHSSSSVANVITVENSPSIRTLKMNAVLVILFVGVIFAVTEANNRKRFDGHKVYGVFATTEEQLDILKNIEEQSKDGVLFWTSAVALNSRVDIMVSPEEEAGIVSAFKTAGISHETFIEDVQMLVDNEQSTKSSNIGGRLDRVNGSSSLNFAAYQPLDVIYEWLDALAETYPDWVEIIIAGNSYEGRPIKGIKITFGESNPGIFIEGGTHAREWITTATAIYLVNDILTTKNEGLKSVYRTHTWFIFPNTNPDGYEYTRSTNRMWRKTRKPYSVGCFGADPNRNWDNYWMAVGASSNPCSETYAGPTSFSEAETKALSDYITTVSDQFFIYISLHSYGQRILLPYGYTYDHLDNYEEAMTVSERTAKALARRYGTNYLWGSITEVMYLASGGSIDWVKDVHKTPISVCFELRDQGTYGFLLPADQIVPTALEFIDGFVVMITETRRLGYPIIHTKTSMKTIYRIRFRYFFMSGSKMRITSIFYVLLIIAEFALSGTEGAHKRRFDGYKVYRVVATSEEQLNVLRDIENGEGDEVLFWTSAGALNYPIDVMVSPEEEGEIFSAFQSANISYETLINDVQTLIDSEDVKNSPGSLLRDNEAGSSLNWTSYHRLDTIYDWLDELAETYPNWVEVIEAGYSYEGRLVKGIKITFDEDNPGIFIEGGQHAREWISSAVVTYVINEILTTTNTLFNLHARAHNWFIFPVTNPDGFEYSHTTNRMWRKTRKPYANDCYGADPNRNFAYYWLTTGASSNPCSSTYAGPEPFSEPEVKVFADYISSVSDKFYIYLSIHSYGQWFLSPFAYSVERPNNYDDLMYMGNRAATAFAKKYGTAFVVGSAAEVLYTNSGNSIDWVKGTFNTPVVYCIELRDKGTYGFLLPAEQIIPSSLEFLDSLIALIAASKNLGYPVIHT